MRIRSGPARGGRPGDAAAGDDPRRRPADGLGPRQYQSGTTDRKGRITRRGPRLLRKLLVERAWCMLRYNPWAREQYAKLTGGGAARKKPAVVALARKLLVCCWAMLRDNKPWQASPAPT